MSGTRVAVAGATGFVGRRLVAALSGAGHTVRAPVREPATPRAAPLCDDHAVETVTGDLACPGSATGLFDGVDVAVYLGGLGGVRAGRRSPPVAARGLAAVTGVHGVVAPLVGSLDVPATVTDPGPRERLGVEPIGFEEAVDRALAATDAAGDTHAREADG
jgi:uncharacterized protein YbjT (DUF2867 family)